MSQGTPIRSQRRAGEEGYMLVAVIFLLAMLVLSLSVALPKVRESIQRDRDLETMHRGQQYVRAIQLYYRKFHAYPPSIDALVKTNEIRFLRKRYIDPTTGKDDWKPIHFGQNKTPTAMGFFGQPLAGSTLAGTGPSGGNGIAGATTLGSSIGGTTSTSPTSGTSPATPTSGIGGSTTSSIGAGTGTGSGTGATGQTFGGAGIIGVSPASPRRSILIFKKQDHYNQWEFTYDPLMDRKTVGNTGDVGKSASSISSGIGGGSGSSTTTTPPTSPLTPTSPQQ